jgi:hypothetical protein
MPECIRAKCSLLGFKFFAVKTIISVDDDEIIKTLQIEY